MTPKQYDAIHDLACIMVRESSTLSTAMREGVKTLVGVVLELSKQCDKLSERVVTLEEKVSRHDWDDD